MTGKFSFRALRMFIGACLLLCAVVANAAQGFTIRSNQEKLIHIGMTRAEVLKAIGRPAHNVKYRNEPGRTWTYGLIGMDKLNSNLVFDVNFGPDDKVLSVAERVDNDWAGNKITPPSLD